MYAQSDIVKLIENTIPTITHALAALVPLSWWSAIRGSFSPVLIVGAIVVGNLPDIDTATSHIGQLVYPLAKRIETRFGHRGITHSLLATVIVAALAYVIDALALGRITRGTTLFGAAGLARALATDATRRAEEILATDLPRTAAQEITPNVARAGVKTLVFGHSLFNDNYNYPLVTTRNAH